MSKERSTGNKRGTGAAKGKFGQPVDKNSKAYAKEVAKAKRTGGGSPDKFFGKAAPKKERIASVDDIAPKKERTPKPRLEPKAETKSAKPIITKKAEEAMPLNKYVAHCGIASRRDAAEIVKEGKIKVNGTVITQPGHKVQPGDTIEYNGKTITSQKNLVYILLNKPKNFITTTDDPQERKTVMQLIADAGDERVYPVGRLDRHTTGLLLLTNDGELAQKLSHPKYNIKKIYQVTLDKALTKQHFENIAAGLTLEDGPVQVDAIAYLEKKNEIGVEIHSGRNRIVRRIFESLGYSVEKLDRVMYAGLTKKNIPRGKWRFLNEKEVINLKYYKQ